MAKKGKLRKYLVDGIEYNGRDKNRATSLLMQAMYSRTKEEAIKKAVIQFGVVTDCVLKLYSEFCKFNGLKIDLVTPNLRNASKKGKAKKQLLTLSFYDSEEWLKLRKKVIKLYGCECMKCGIKNVEIHVAILNLVQFTRILNLIFITYNVFVVRAI